MSAVREPNTIYTGAVDSAGQSLGYGTRTSYEASDDMNLSDAVLEFKYAARRDGRALVVWVAPAWVGRLLGALDIRGIVRQPRKWSPRK